MRRCGRLRLLLIAAGGWLVLGPGGDHVQAETFGRWQQSSRRCEVEQPAGPVFPCRGVQLDQRNAQVLRLSLDGEGPARGEVTQFTLVGALAEGSEPMACRNGSCRLSRPLQLQLVSLSIVRFDARGLAQTLPPTWPVQGSCRIDPAALSCTASVVGSSDGALQTWVLEAEL
jgi:hypothetical protein